ncbi:triphosphoribosyl-dephospho-CoA synthase CitG [Aliiruegeria lutimaris]|uniref:Probable 2-(5''-triphosphoribosyl)-3'-dephosphocoenzyme-A synthase n=1 Tax=Aliiruegeria lutimaris TaxID=571298 RepID=A0A1G9AN57_9RHOB|nr:triphosphoribosyl-dephospho-CoA synthase CitG [Aliiruegeria lutimaris]SDK28020.1 triphosphoribosyl-dephospho-CoA synthase [Aliiruegeria lutimaris]
MSLLAREISVLTGRGTGQTAAAPLVSRAGYLSQLVHEALLVEVHLTPKPGLVDLRNNGAHSDMNVATFEASAAAIAPFFEQFFLSGVASADMPATEALPELRRLGLIAEAAMFRATDGVNTHKGAIFAFGLALGAAGRLTAKGAALETVALCGEVAAIAAGIVARDLDGANRTATTAGEYIYRRYGIRGARGEAESGFATVREIGLAAFRAARSHGAGEERCLLAALAALLAQNADTNLIARGGPEATEYVRREAEAIAGLGANASDFIARLEALDDALIARNLSPGGTADLVGLTWFFARLESSGA